MAAFPAYLVAAADLSDYDIQLEYKIRADQDQSRTNLRFSGLARKNLEGYYPSKGMKCKL